MQAEIVQLVRDHPYRSPVCQFEFLRQQLLRSIVIMANTGTPTEEIAEEVRGTVKAINDTAILIGAIEAQRAEFPGDLAPDVPMPCLQTHGAIFWHWLQKQLRHLTDQAPERTDA